nr:phage tail fiber host specificity protein [uncultured Mediterranean phage uvMED]
MSNILQTIGVNNLSLRGGSTTFNRLDRFFNTVAEAEAAVAGGDYTPDANATNGVLIADIGFAVWNFDTSTFDAVNFPQLTAEGVLTQKINDIFDGLVVTVGQTADGLITEKGLRVAGDAALSGRVSTLEADPTTASALNTETTNRQTADTTLQTNIDTEATTRENADAALTTALTNEASTRASADTALDGRLDVLETSVPLLTATVSDDAAARNSADAALSARLDILESDPTTATALTTAISQEVTDRNAAITAATSALVDGAPGLLDTLNEIAAAVGDDANFATTITNSIAAETSAREAADNTLTAAVNTETAARIAGDALKADLAGATFTGAIVAPSTGSIIPFYYATQGDFPSASTYHGAIAHSHADGAMYFAHGGAWIELGNSATLAAATAQVQTNLDAEAVTRAAADTTLQTNITNEAAARLAADSTLSGRLDTAEATLGDRTATQISYVDASSSIQTQLDTKITESAVALLIASEADNLQTQLNDINTRLTNAGY